MRTNAIALAAAIVVLLAAGLIRVATFDDDSEVKTAAGGTTVTTTVATLPTPTTTSTTTPPTTAPAPTVAPTTTPTTAASAPTTTAAPAPAAAAPDCGKGETRAQSTITPESQADGSYLLTVKVQVINDLTKAIGIDRLAAKLHYDDGSSDVVEVPSAKGAEVAAKATITFEEKKASPKVPSSSTIEALDFHIVGQPSCPPKHLQT